MEAFMSFALLNDTEITVRTNAIIACHSMTEKGTAYYKTQLIVQGIEKPIVVKGEYEDIKSWIERASE